MEAKPPFRLTLPVACLVGVALACTLTPPVPAARSVITITEDLTGFDRIALADGFQATIRRGEAFSVVIRIDEDLEAVLRSGVSGGELRLGLDPQADVLTNLTREVEVTMPSLSRLEASGASAVRVTGFDGGASFEADLSGASSLGGDLVAGDLTLTASGASSIDLTGSGQALTLHLDGGSSADLRGFPVTSLEAFLSGAASAAVNATARLDATLSGGSRLVYLGSPTLGYVEISGGSSLQSESR